MKASVATSSELLGIISLPAPSGGSRSGTYSLVIWPTCAFATRTPSNSCSRHYSPCVALLRFPPTTAGESTQSSTSELVINYIYIKIKKKKKHHCRLVQQHSRYGVKRPIASLEGRLQGGGRLVVKC
jgi:hypothetical protein